MNRTRAWAKLSKLQKAELSILAAEAYAARMEFIPVNIWRRDESIKACGRRISEATQGDYLRLKAWFQDLAGNSGQAFETNMRAETEGDRVAMFKLKEVCTKKGLALDYPSAICRRQYRCELVDASEKQLWNLFYTVSNRSPKPKPAI